MLIKRYIELIYGKEIKNIRTETKNALKKMDENNLIVFCRPRHDAYRAYFEKYLRNLENQN